MLKIKLLAYFIKAIVIPLMTKLLSFLGQFLLFSILTITTQIGGIDFLLAKYCSRLTPQLRKTKLSQLALFIGIYGFTTFIIVPPIAQAFGRTPLPISSKGMIIPNHFWTCLLNRHYVKIKLYDVVRKAAIDYNANEKNVRQLRYLDASFPFFDGFPLLPHRSHDDGEKIDLAFFYVDRSTNQAWNKSVSLSGYGFCEKPTERENNTPRHCAKQGYWQYSLLTKMFGKASPDKVQFDAEANRRLIKSLSAQSRIKKIFIEPHLKARLGFAHDNKIRFHGCSAVRHDDHIHVEL